MAISTTFPVPPFWLIIIKQNWHVRFLKQLFTNNNIVLQTSFMSWVRMKMFILPQKFGYGILKALNHVSVIHLTLYRDWDNAQMFHLSKYVRVQYISEFIVILEACWFEIDIYACLLWKWLPTVICWVLFTLTLVLTLM